MFRPLVVSCEFLASAMLHTCLKLQQPAPTRRSDQLTYHQPEALVQAATFKSHCHSRLTLPSISADRWQRKSMESRRITFNIVTALSGVATLLSVKPPWRVTLVLTAASSSPDHLPSLPCDRHISLIIKIQTTFTKQPSQQVQMVS
jgi:hypothetical protein